MTDTPKVPGDAGKDNAVTDAPTTGRRRFLQAGITATPVIMTVLSGPVLANFGANDCVTPSAFGSIDSSNNLQGDPCA